MPEFSELLRDYQSQMADFVEYPEVGGEIGGRILQRSLFESPDGFHRWLFLVTETPRGLSIRGYRPVGLRGNLPQEPYMTDRSFEWFLQTDSLDQLALEFGIVAQDSERLAMLEAIRCTCQRLCPHGWKSGRQL